MMILAQMILIYGLNFLPRETGDPDLSNYKVEIRQIFIELRSERENEVIRVQLGERLLLISKALIEAGDSKFLGLIPLNTRIKDAEEILSKIRENFPGESLEVEALNSLIEIYQLQGNDSQIEETANCLIRLSHRVDLYPVLINAARAQYRGKEYDQSPYERTLGYLRAFEKINPEDYQAYIVDEKITIAAITESLAEALMSRAEWYRAQGDLYSFRFILKRLVLRYPDTMVAEKARNVLRGF
ncbi:MAG: hypothetical protein COV44_03250 [Deltaproteobacteria bacterium CG11_big_fil_rev_8_21_14_0_20_45_16]|nr:MAG: hypothetical protein COV44_03250 [Deltaproteobacteria bacterium CG11_big_fil_rev_8_21_14_0_20_45_16]